MNRVQVINLKYIIVFCLSLYFIQGISAQNIAPDSFTTVQNERSFDKDFMEFYKNNAAYSYEKDPRLSSNPIKTWWQNLWRKFSNFIEDATSPEVWKMLRFLFIIGIILLIVYHLSHAQKSGILGKKDTVNAKAEVRFESGELLVSEISGIIMELESAGAYRTAIRWHYLKTIQNLNGAGYVQWDEKNSNMQLLAQIKDPPTKNTFSELVKIFEYTWYGKHELNSESIYHKLKLKFDQFNQKITGII
jgi:hypothetical protein